MTAERTLLERRVEVLRRLVEVRRERARRAAVDHACDSLAAFVRYAWPAAEPGRPYLHNWHLEVVCARLEAVHRGDLQSLVLCQPPRTMKSYLVNVFLPAWIWLRNPETQFLSVSNSDDLAKRDSFRTRNVVRSELYRVLVERMAERGGPKSWALSTEQSEKTNFVNSLGGSRECVPILGRVTGRGCDYLLLDDVYDAKDAVMGDPTRVAERMAEAVAIHDTALLSRFNPGGPKRKITIMQRLHDADIAGVLIGRGEPSLVLPMEYDPDAADPSDRRWERGEVLVPPEWLPQPLDAWKVALGSQASGQLQQRPTLAEGGILPRAAWRWLDARHMPKAAECDVAWAAWDLAFGGKAAADWCAGFVVGYKGGRVYGLDGERLRAEFPGQQDAVRRLQTRNPEVYGVAIENAANGKAAKASLENPDTSRGEPLAGIVLVTVREDKVARAQAWSPLQEAGNVVLPCRCGQDDIHEHGPHDGHLLEPWALALVIESASFPKGANDDQVDAFGMAVSRAIRGGPIAVGGA